MTRIQRYAQMTIPLFFVLVLLPLGTVSQAQPVIAELDELEEELFDLQRIIDRERRAGTRNIAVVQDEVDALADELTYLRVKQRKEGPLTGREIRALRAQIEDLADRLDEGIWEAPARRTDERVSENSDPIRPMVPVGAEMEVELQTSLHSDRSAVEDPVRATTVDDLYVDNAMIPAGSEIRGVVTAVDRSSRTDRTSSITVKFDEIRIDGTTYPATLSVVEALESGGLKDDAGRAGVGAGVGGVIGGLLGGVRGALAGILIGAGGTVMATEGEDVDLPAGTLLRVRFDTELTLQ